jgi:hypothetical protein
MSTTVHKAVPVLAYWIGPVDVDVASVLRVEPQWLGGACGCRIKFRNGNWIAVSPADARRVQLLMA